MARFARHSARVLGSIHLRETHRLSDVLLMAAGADHRRVGQRRIQRGGIVGVNRQRSMAGLAIHVRMFPVALGFRYIRMAGFAGLMAGVTDRLGRQFAQRSAAIVSVLAERLRNKKSAQDEKSKNAGKKNGSQTEKMA